MSIFLAGKLGFDPPSQQVGNHLVRRLTGIQECVHLLNDGHLHPRRWARAKTERQVRTPSATIDIPCSTAASGSPRPSRIPTMRFRLRSLVQVNTRSPMPERPERVWGSAPIRTARRVTSASPRVINAARALYPHPSPSLTPAAMAITFFTAPPTSTPTTSE